MKNTNTFLARGITAAFFVSAVALPAFADLEPAGGPLDDLLNNVATETVESTALKVQNLSVLPANGKAVLMWDPVSDESNSIISKYKISYGKTSVEEGLAESYEDSMKLELDTEELSTVGVARSEISGLKNGEKYFFIVQAIDADGKVGAASEEKFTTPSLVPVDDQEDADTPVVLELKTAEALTSTLVKATFSKDIVLPEDEELRKKTFTLQLKSDESTTFEIKDVVFRENYLQDESSDATPVEKGKDLYILLENAVEKDTEYQLTASARLKDVDENSIDNGIADNVFFTGTDALEIPESEKIIAPETEKPEKTADPLAALLGGESSGANIKETGEDTAKTEEDESLHSAPRDHTAPEDITNLRAKLVKRITDFVVNLTWTKSKNTAGDLVQQLLYTSIDSGKTWGSPKKFNGDLEEYVFTGKPNTSYTVKVTTKDRSGNESKGVVKTIRVPELVSSGAPMFLALGLALLGGGAQIARRRRV